MDRTEDLKILKYAGLMGHEYIGIEGVPGKRRVHMEGNSLKSVEADGRGKTNPEVYSKIKGRWTACSSI